MDSGLSSSHAKRCDLLTIAEFERLLGFQACARVILGAVERCRASPGGCASPYRCAARIAAPTGAQDHTGAGLKSKKSFELRDRQEIAAFGMAR
jgi:hypothetical protein